MIMLAVEEDCASGFYTNKIFHSTKANFKKISCCIFRPVSLVKLNGGQPEKENGGGRFPQ